MQSAAPCFGELAQHADVALRLRALGCKGGCKGLAVHLKILQHTRQAALQCCNLVTLLLQPPCLANMTPDGSALSEIPWRDTCRAAIPPFSLIMLDDMKEHRIP